MKTKKTVLLGIVALLAGAYAFAYGNVLLRPGETVDVGGGNIVTCMSACPYLNNNELGCNSIPTCTYVQPGCRRSNDEPAGNMCLLYKERRICESMAMFCHWSTAAECADKK